MVFRLSLFGRGPRVSVLTGLFDTPFLFFRLVDLLRVRIRVLGEVPRLMLFLLVLLLLVLVLVLVVLVLLGSSVRPRSLAVPATALAA